MPVLRERFDEWRRAATTQRIYLKWRARGWFAFGVVGLLDYKNIIHLPGTIADSVPVLFFISVYANYAGDKGTSQGFRVEEKQEDAERQAHTGGDDA